MRAWLLLAGLAVASVLPSLGAPLLADDYIHIERVRTATSFYDLLGVWVLRASDTGAWWSPPDLEVRYFRPLVAASFAFDHALWGLDAFGYRLTNLWLHVTTTWLVAAIALRLFGGGVQAWGAAALFAVHPAHAEAVAWISGRTDVLAGAFAALAYLAHLRARESGAWRDRLLVVAATAAALASKEVAVAIPALLLLHEFVWERGERSFGTPLAAVATIALGLVLRHLVVGPVALPPPPFAVDPSGVLEVARHLARATVLYGADLALFLPPDPMITGPFWEAQPLAFALLAAVTGATLWASWRDIGCRPLRHFGLLWTVVALLPSIPLAPGERFLYLPSIGYSLWLAGKLPQRWSELDRRSTGAVAAVILLVAMLKSGLWGGFALRGREAIEDAAGVIAAAPNAELLVAIDLPPAAALGFPHALRLATPGRNLQVEVASLGRLWPGAMPATHVSHPAEDLWRLERAAGVRASHIERAYLGRGRLRAGEHVARAGISVDVLEVDAGGHALRFALRTHRPAVVLRGDGRRWLTLSGGGSPPARGAPGPR